MFKAVFDPSEKYLLSMNNIENHVVDTPAWHPTPSQEVPELFLRSLATFSVRP